jgi:hypothetical protein
VLNLGYFGVEFVMARVIGSVSLFTDSIDFLEDATVNGLILIESPAPDQEHQQPRPHVAALTAIGRQGLSAEAIAHFCVHRRHSLALALIAFRLSISPFS